MTTTSSLFGLLGSSTSCSAVDLTSDSLNWYVAPSRVAVEEEQLLTLLSLSPARSGAVGNICSFQNGAGSCSNGVCKLSSCNTGYYQLTGSNVCTSLNLQSDAANWCASSFPFSFALATLSLLCLEQPQLTSVPPRARSGAVGKVCPTTLGSPVCSAGSCAYKSCNSGYTLLNGQCSQINLQSDINNWCVPHRLLFLMLLKSRSDLLFRVRSGKIGNACPSTYANGGSSTCNNGVCSTSCKSGYAFDTTYNFCRDVSCDTSNWCVLAALTSSPSFFLRGLTSSPLASSSQRLDRQQVRCHGRELADLLVGRLPRDVVLVGHVARRRLVQVVRLYERPEQLVRPLPLLLSKLSASRS